MAQARSLGSIVGPIAGKLAGGRRMAMAEVAVRWRDIVGDDLADRCIIDKFVPQRAGQSDGGTLTLRTHPADALDVQHAGGLIAERVNAYLGHRAVGRIRLVPGRVPGQPKPPRRPRPLSPAEEAEIAAALADVQSPDLRQALAELGAALYRADET
ncbi:MAG: DUF721 domain-containing protein [Rhodospirillaceae bacterium]|nr:DUF721 domain-containing protein [Rhodospirillaceae bacterium]